jgi:ribonucleoside-diphosphate reductase alpha chain
MTEHYGPTLPISQEIYQDKYCLDGESFKESKNRFAGALTETEEEYRELREILLDMRFMGGGRTQAAIGSPRRVTAFNCFVSGTIEDSMSSIMERATESAETMRKGGGIGYDFSTLRPKGDRIVSLDSRSCGPIPFMGIYDSVCQTISSAGHRRGAQMGVLRVDHPDIEEFVHAKQNDYALKGFNISIGITDEFMEAVRDKRMFPLQFEGKVYKEVYAPALWEEIMRSTWDWAEPGVLFIDRINTMNNLYYCETIAATNPCGEQPLPPYGACLLGSFNLTKYIVDTEVGRRFDLGQFRKDIPIIVRAMDNIHDNTVFPLPQQQKESQDKRRMGLGFTGVANAGEALGFKYGSGDFLIWFEHILSTFRDEAYRASALLAKEKGSFPLYHEEDYLAGAFIKTLPEDVRETIKKYGIRNSHLISMAPTGTISLTADNVSGGIEPVFSHHYERTIKTFEGEKVERVEDYAYRVWGVEGKTADECSAEDHLAVLALAQQYTDSAVSKTINVSPDMPWEEFKSIYMRAWEMGCKGCTTFNSGGKRYGILNTGSDDRDDSSVSSISGSDSVVTNEKVEACYINALTGQKECS